MQPAWQWLVWEHFFSFSVLVQVCVCWCVWPESWPKGEHVEKKAICWGSPNVSSPDLPTDFFNLILLHRTHSNVGESCNALHWKHKFINAKIAEIIKRHWTLLYNEKSHSSPYMSMCTCSAALNTDGGSVSQAYVKKIVNSELQLLWTMAFILNVKTLSLSTKAATIHWRNRLPR